MSDYKSLSIKDWALEDRPREKMMSKGSKSLSTAELLAIIIGSGNRKQSAVEVAKMLLAENQNNLNELAKKSIRDLMKTPGIGSAKAISILAVLELGSRQKSFSAKQKLKITSSMDAYERLQPYVENLNREEFWVVYLNRGNKILEIKNISSGGITGTIFDMRLVFKDAILLESTNIILCHNHPSGNLTPRKLIKI